MTIGGSYLVVNNDFQYYPAVFPVNYVRPELVNPIDWATYPSLTAIDKIMVIDAIKAFLEV